LLVKIKTGDLSEEEKFQLSQLEKNVLSADELVSIC
jgi:hypothetical protein